jgi:hypothetical protein
VLGRATTCWKACREGDRSVASCHKNSWQHPEREQEGELSQKATGEKVVNAVRNYHHETVQVGREDDAICKNVRKGLEVTRATSYIARRLIISPNTSKVHRNTRKGRSTSTTGRKWSSNHYRQASVLVPALRRKTEEIRQSGIESTVALSSATTETNLQGKLLSRRARCAGGLHRRLRVSKWLDPLVMIIPNQQLNSCLSVSF